MNQFIQKATFAGHEINQPFLHQQEIIPAGFIHQRIRLDQFTALENNCNFIEYILIVTEGKLIDAHFFVQVNGQDMWDRLPALYYNKIFPLECEGLYDEETNQLLRDMVRKSDDTKNILFLPFRTAKNGYLLDMSPESEENVPWRHADTITLCIMGLQPNIDTTIDIYLKVSKTNSKNIEKMNYSYV